MPKKPKKNPKESPESSRESERKLKSSKKYEIIKNITKYEIPEETKRIQ